MTKYRIIGIAVVLSAAIATPALAGVIDEPGLYAFYHPNGDLGFGTSRPSDAMASQTMRGDSVAGMRMSVRAHHIARAPAIKRH